MKRKENEAMLLYIEKLVEIASRKIDDGEWSYLENANKWIAEQVLKHLKARQNLDSGLVLKNISHYTDLFCRNLTIYRERE